MATGLRACLAARVSDVPTSPGSSHARAGRSGHMVTMIFLCNPRGRSSWERPVTGAWLETNRFEAAASEIGRDPARLVLFSAPHPNSTVRGEFVHN